MYNPETELLFPARIMPVLRDLRSTAWQELVDQVISAGPSSLEQIAFILMMSRVNNCATCNSDAYRALNGCAVCSRQSLKRSRASDQAMTELFQKTSQEVCNYIQKISAAEQADPLDNLKNDSGEHAKENQF